MSNSIMTMDSQSSEEITSVNNKTNFVLKSEKNNENLNEEKRQNFLKVLKHFHDNRGTPYLKFPKIGGKEIDLFKLYNAVTNLGGWIKVNNRNEWDKILLEFDLPLKCVNASVAIKHIYIRYLDRYEKLHYHKDDGERGDDEDEESRHKRWSARTLHSVPMSYNNNQHNISDALRTQHKLSTNLYKSSEYEKLLMSLLSPLPNEQDFAINVCTLMANESKHTLKVEKCPKLIDTLLAHSGVYNHFTTREIFIEFYSKIRRHSLQSFWNDCLIDCPELLELSLADYFPADDKTTKNKDDIISKQASYIKEFYTNKDKKCKFKENLYSNLDFLCLGRGLGTHDYIGQRIHQIASILRNLSFIDENLIILAHNRTYVRFLVLCSNIRWGNLQHMGLDMLGNISPEIELNDPDTDDLSKCLLTTISEGLECSDRAVIISCLEILYKLCQKETNEDFLHKSFKKNLYNQVCMFLSLSDIMLLLYTLECIYALSSLGEKSCNAIVQVRGAIDSLVSLVTVEAQSYGPDACILMRVVETVPGNVANATTTQVQQQQSTNFTTLNNTIQTTTSINATADSLASIIPVQSTPMHEIATSAIVQHQSPVRKSPTLLRPNKSQSPQTPPTVIQTVNKEQITVTNNVAAKHAQQQVVQENEQFALAWLRAIFEPVLTLTSRIEQQELYKLYITASTKLGRRGVVSPLHFPRCVRSVFGGTVGPNPIKVEQDNNTEITSFFYEGIRLRPKPLAVIHKGNVVVAPQQICNNTQQSTVETIKKQNEVISVIGKVTNNQIQTQQVQLQQQPQPQLQQLQHQQSPQLQSNIITNTKQQNSSVLVAQLCGKNVIINQQQQQQQQQQAAPILQKVLTSSNENFVVTSSQTSNIQQQQHTFIQQQQHMTVVQQQHQQSPQINSNLGTTGTQPTSSSVIKCLLANKVTPTNDTVAATSSNLSTCLIAPNVNMHQVAQRQQLQKQKELALQQNANQNNQTSCIKIGNKTIITNTSINDKKLETDQHHQQQQQQQQQAQLQHHPHIIHHQQHPQHHLHLQNHHNQNTTTNWEVPPLAPLSCTTNRQQQHQPQHQQHQQTTIVAHKLDDDSNSTGNNSVTSSNVNTFDAENSITSFDELLIHNNNTTTTSTTSSTSSILIPHDDEYNNTALILSTKPSHVVTANKMLADLLEKKSTDPPTSINNYNNNNTNNNNNSSNCNSNNNSNQSTETNSLKRKLELISDNSESSSEKRILQQHQQQQPNDEIEEQTVRPSAKAADLYAELAASMLEDEDEELDDENSIKGMLTQTQSTVTAVQKINPQSTIVQVDQHSQTMQQQHQQHQQTQQQQQQQQLHHQQQIQQLQQHHHQQQQQQQQQHHIHQQFQQQQHQQQIVLQQHSDQQQQQMISLPVPMQRQIIMSPTNSQQMMFTGGNTGQITTQTTATIKTESGYQTVPVLLQHTPNSAANLQLQKQLSAGGQFQLQSAQNQTQYVLTTNQQGQSVIVAQQPQQQQQQMHQTVLVTQTPQQQGTSAKTIIILQQQSPNVQQQQTSGAIMGTVTNSGSPQKVIMTTQQGQQVVVTQVPRPMQHHMIMNHPQITTNSQSIMQQQNVITTMAQNITAPTIIQTPMMQVAQMPEKHIQITSSGIVAAASTTPQIIKNEILMPVNHPPTPIQTPTPPPLQQQQQQQPTPTVVQPTMTQPIVQQSVQPIVQSSVQPIQQPVKPPTPQPQPPPIIEVTPKVEQEIVDPNWLWVCDWRGCPRKKFRSANEVYIHACAVHCPDNLDPNAEIYCQWGSPSLCDNLPRKRFSLMTHIFDRHCTIESFKASIQRRISTGIQPNQPTQPVTIIKQPQPNSVTECAASSSAALHAIKRHALDFVTSKELMTGTIPITNNSNIKNNNHNISDDSSNLLSSISTCNTTNCNSSNSYGGLIFSSDENEGPVTKSIRLTAALILRNLVNYSSAAKRSLRYYEPHLAGVSLSNVESSRTIAQVLYEMNETI